MLAPLLFPWPRSGPHFLNSRIATGYVTSIMTVSTQEVTRKGWSSLLIFHSVATSVFHQEWIKNTSCERFWRTVTVSPWHNRALLWSCQQKRSVWG